MVCSNALQRPPCLVHSKGGFVGCATLQHTQIRRMLRGWAKQGAHERVRPPHGLCVVLRGLIVMCGVIPAWLAGASCKGCCCLLAAATLNCELVVHHLAAVSAQVYVICTAATCGQQAPSLEHLLQCST